MRLTLAAPVLMTLSALPALAEAPAVIADIPATGSLVQQVLGDLGEVRVLLPAGGNPHNHQMRPSDAAALQDAGLLVWVGPELTPWLARASASLAGGTALQLLGLPQTQRQGFGAAVDAPAADDAHDHDHDDHAGETEAEHAAHAEEPASAEGHDGHDHGEDAIDAHAWLNPANGQAWLTAIAEALSKADPENAQTYAENAAKAVADLQAQEAQLTAQLQPIKDKPFIVFHDAYGYFTRHFGLTPAVAVSLGDASTPSAARLSAIRDQIGGQQITCAFPEAGHDPALIQSVTEGTDIRAGGVLDPSGVELPQGPQLYGALLSGLAETLTECLSKAE